MTNVFRNQVYSGKGHNFFQTQPIRAAPQEMNIPISVDIGTQIDKKKLSHRAAYSLFQSLLVRASSD